jgi:serine/threonine protein kinase
MISRLRHPNITTMIGASIESRTSQIVVNEYIECGSLYDVLHNLTDLKRNQYLSLLRDIVQGLQFLHNSRSLIVHGDLKAQVGFCYESKSSKS